MYLRGVSTAEGKWLVAEKLTRKQCVLFSFLPWPGLLSLSFSVKEKHSTSVTHVIMWVSITCCFLILFSPHLTTVWPYKSPAVTASLSLRQQSWRSQSRLTWQTPGAVKGVWLPSLGSCNPIARMNFGKFLQKPPRPPDVFKLCRVKCSVFLSSQCWAYVLVRLRQTHTQTTWRVRVRKRSCISLKYLPLFWSFWSNVTVDCTHFRSKTFLGCHKHCRKFSQDCPLKYIKRCPAPKYSNTV